MNARLLSSTASHGSTADDRPIERFREAIVSTGLVPPEHIEADSRLHRFHVAGDKPGSRNGWYILHLDRHPAGAFGSWKLRGTHTWSSDQTTISAAQQRRFARLVEAARVKEQAELQGEQEALAALDHQLLERRLVFVVEANDNMFAVLCAGVRIHEDDVAGLIPGLHRQPADT